MTHTPAAAAARTFDLLDELGDDMHSLYDVEVEYGDATVTIRWDAGDWPKRFTTDDAVDELFDVLRTYMEAELAALNWEFDPTDVDPDNDGVWTGVMRWSYEDGDR